MIGQTLDRPRQPRAFGHVGEQIVDRIGADHAEHLAPVGIGKWQVAHSGFSENLEAIQLGVWRERILTRRGFQALVHAISADFHDPGWHRIIEADRTHARFQFDLNQAERSHLAVEVRRPSDRKPAGLSPSSFGAGRRLVKAAAPAMAGTDPARTRTTRPLSSVCRATTSATPSVGAGAPLRSPRQGQSAGRRRGRSSCRLPH